MRTVVFSRVFPKVRGVEGNGAKMVLQHFLASAIAFPIPTIVHFWQGCGLTMTEIMVLQAIFAVGIAVSYLVMNNVLALAAKKFPRILPLVNQKYAWVH